MILKIIGFILLAIVVAFVARSFYVSRPLFKEQMSVAPIAAYELAQPTQALSFARTLDGKSLLVTTMTREGIEGIDLAAATGRNDAEPLGFLRALGDDAIAALMSGDAVAYDWDALGVPFDTNSKIIAAGTNFLAHAEETGLEDGPFLFPKLSAPTPWQTPVKQRTRLDYEVELCAVAVDDIGLAKQGRFGFVLCNDLTDRWALLRDIDLNQPLGLTGFPEGKGGEGMLPMGAIMAVPRDGEFYKQIKLGLSVNDRLRQRSSAGLMIWDAPSIAQKALSMCEADYMLGDEVIRIADCNGLARGTAILLGTPEGVAFQMPNVWMAWAYLRRGDRVLTYGTHLGVLRTQIQ